MKLAELQLGTYGDSEGFGAELTLQRSRPPCDVSQRVSHSGPSAAQHGPSAAPCNTMHTHAWTPYTERSRPHATQLTLSHQAKQHDMSSCVF